MIKVDLVFDPEVIEKLKDRVKAYAVEVLQYLTEAVVDATPVDTGFLRASWRFALNSEGGTGLGGIDLASSLTLGDIYYAVNGANYAVYVEYGTSKMAPRAFVRGTVERAPQIVAQAAARVTSAD